MKCLNYELILTPTAFILRLHMMMFKSTHDHFAMLMILQRLRRFILRLRKVSSLGIKWVYLKFLTDEMPKL